MWIRLYFVASVVAAFTFALGSPAVAKKLKDKGFRVNDNFTTEVRLTAEFRTDCLNSLVETGEGSGRCEATGTITSCKESKGSSSLPSKSCAASIKIALNGADPKVSPFGTNCYAIAIENQIWSHDGSEWNLEGIGLLCFTPQGNIVDAVASCRHTSSNGDSFMCIGRHLQGEMELRETPGQGNYTRKNMSIILCDNTTD